MTSTGDDEIESDFFSDDDANSDALLEHGQQPDSRLDSDVDEEDNDLSDDSSERENRFVGPSSTWRSFTEDERALAASLDQLQANDLSLHLYGAHALKARGRAAESGTSKTRSYRNKAHHGELDSDSDPPWAPEVAWTAWPVKPQDVPSIGESFGVPLSSHEDEATYGESYRRPDEPKPDSELNEEIKAIMLKHATAQFRDLATHQSVDIEDIDGLIDDEKAEDVLQPAVGNIRSQLDDLFWRLQGKKNRHPLKRKRNQSQSSRSRSTSRANTWRRPTTSTELVSDSEGDDSEVMASDGENQSRTTGRPDRRRPKHLKGWKEVLEAARFVGFDQAAIDRATHRCAALFGEDMKLSNMYDCPIESCNRHGVPFEKAWRWREHLRRTHKYDLAEVYDSEASLKSTTVVAISSGRSSADLDADDST